MIILMFIIASPIAIYYDRRKKRTPQKEYTFEFTIIGDKGRDHKEIVESDNESVEIKFNEETYTGSLSESWKKEKGLFRKKIIRSLIFFEGGQIIPPKDGRGKEVKLGLKAIYSPIPVIIPSRLLKIAKYYDQLNDAVKDQFKDEGKGFDIPLWLGAIVVVVIIILAAYFGLKYVDAIKQTAKDKANALTYILLSVIR